MLAAIRHLILEARFFLSNPVADKTLFETYATIMATVITLLMTVTLIPMQQCASQYSPSFLRYFQRDRQLRGYLFLMVGTFIVILVFLVRPTYGWALISATMLVGLSLLCMVQCIRRITVMLNPVQYLLPEAKREVLATLKSAFKIADQLSEIPDVEEWQKGFDLGSAVRDYPEFGERFILIPADRIEPLRSGMMPLKTLALRMIGASDYEAFAQLIKDLGEISQQYLVERKSYRTYNDEFIWFVSDTFEHLIRTAESNPDASFAEVLFSTIADCAAATLKVNVLGVKEGYNQLQLPFSRLLIQSAWRQLDRKETISALDAFTQYARVGRNLARSGFGQSAEEVSSKMYSFGYECLARKDTYTCYPLFDSMPRILLLATLHGRVYRDYENPYDTMTVIVSLLLKKSIELKLEDRLTDPLFDYSNDVSKSPNISWICYAALFSSHNDPAVATHTFRVVERIWKVVEEHHIGSGNFEQNLTWHLYQIGLMLLASIHAKIVSAIDAPATVLSTPTEPRRKLLIRILDHAWKSYGKAHEPSLVERLEAETDRKYIRFSGPLLDKALSLSYLTLHFDNDQSLLAQDLKQNLPKDI